MTATTSTVTAPKTVLGEDGPVVLAIPRDRQGTFEPQLIMKNQRRFKGFDQKIIALYARGMTVREIQGFLLEQYDLEVSPDFISLAIEGVQEEVTLWQNRPLETLYSIVVFDALRVKIHDGGSVQNKAVPLALGIRPDGLKEVMGLWIETSEGAQFWLQVMTELKNRGVPNILIDANFQRLFFGQKIHRAFRRRFAIPAQNFVRLHDLIF